jgi:hypothetical protein
MKHGRNRVETQDHKNKPAPATPVPVVLVPVHPPPELVRQCPRCGAARPNLWNVPGGNRTTNEHRRKCRSCGTVVRFSDDFKMVRIIG